MLVALSDGPSYAALPLARRADPRLIGNDLARQIRTALDDPAPVYAPELEEFSRRSVDRLVAERLLPALLAHA